MLEQIEGSQGDGEARSALCRPQVVCAYPITPQTHIVEGLGELVRLGEIENCEFINVESEFAALSVAIGASAAGARAYTATASQGLLFMAEAVYNAAGLGLPIVMTLGNRAIGAPINIWNDHSDAMAMRESGWIQLFAETNQEAADLHILAFRLAEELSVPTMVCVDGFILTHAVERVDIPTRRRSTPSCRPTSRCRVLDPADPISIGAMVGPDAFTEVRYLQYYKQHSALPLIDKLAAEFERRFGREAGGLLANLRSRRRRDARRRHGFDQRHDQGRDRRDARRRRRHRPGHARCRSARSRPRRLRQALARARDVIVIDKAVDVGMGGPLASNIAIALRELPEPPAMHSAIVGLGGRPAPKASLHRLFRQATSPALGGPAFPRSQRAGRRRANCTGAARRAASVRRPKAS